MLTRNYIQSMTRVSGRLFHWTRLTHQQRNPEGSAKIRKLHLDKYKIQKGFALVIINEKFQTPPNRYGADVDRKNIKEFCNLAKFTVNDMSGLEELSIKKNNGDLKTDDLTAKEMKDLFNTVSKGDFSSHDAFVCFISSHGNSEGISGADKKVISLKEILQPFEKCVSLVGKPKLFFIQSCRGGKEDIIQQTTEADNGDPNNPTGADILVAYSTVDGYKSYRYNTEGSCFITELTKVFKKHAHNMNLTEMLAMVNKEVAKEVFRCNDGMGFTHNKQMPCFSSSLRKHVFFDVPKPLNHAPSSLP